MIPSGEQVCLQGVHSDGDPFYGIGSALDFEEQHKEDEFNVCLFNTKYINSILDKHNVVRTRVMRQQRKTCYSYHIDYTKRIHIPVYTNEDCFLILDDILSRSRTNLIFFCIKVCLLSLINSLERKFFLIFKRGESTGPKISRLSICLSFNFISLAPLKLKL